MKIDINRMSKLLDDFNEVGVNTIEKKKAFIDLKKAFSDNYLNPNLDDLLDILNIKGSINAYSGISETNNASEDIALNIKLHKIKRFHSGFLILITNPKFPIFRLDKIMQELFDKIVEYDDFQFGAYSDEELKNNEIKYFAIFSNIENVLSLEPSNKLQDSYKKLLTENKYLKEQNERMQQSLISLLPYRG